MLVIVNNSGMLGTPVVHRFIEELYAERARPGRQGTRIATRSSGEIEATARIARRASGCGRLAHPHAGPVSVRELDAGRLEGAL